MNAWRKNGFPKFQLERPERPSDPQVLDAPELSEEWEGLELDLMRRVYVNLRHECADLEKILRHVRSTNAPFTKRDLTELDKAIRLMRVGFKVMKRVIKHERKWSPSGSLDNE